MRREGSAPGTSADSPECDGLLRVKADGKLPLFHRVTALAWFGNRDIFTGSFLVPDLIRQSVENDAGG